MPVKEPDLSSPPDPGILEAETAMDLAYRCVLPSSIGYAIHKMEVPLVSEPTVEDVATLLDLKRLCKEDEDRVAMLQKQRPVIMMLRRSRWDFADCEQRCGVGLTRGRVWLLQVVPRRNHLCLRLSPAKFYL